MTDGQSELARAAGEPSSGLPVCEPDKCLGCENRLHGQACDDCADNPDPPPALKEAEAIAGELSVEATLEGGGQ